MNFLVPLLASIALLLGSAVLLSTVGRRRRQRARPLPAAELEALEGVVGNGLAQLVGGAVTLRQQLEDVAASGRDLLAVERHLSGSARRPLWRQIEDANFGHELDGLRREVIAWLGCFDELDASERQIVEQLGLDVEPVRALVPADSAAWREPGTQHVRERSAELREVEAQLDGAIACLRRVEREILAYRGGGYR